MKYEVTEFRTTAETYEVEAASEQEAEDLISCTFDADKPVPVRKWTGTFFYEVKVGIADYLNEVT